MQSDSFLRRLLMTVGVITVVVLVVLFILHTLEALLLLFTAVLIGIFLHGVAVWVSEHTGLSEKIALALVITGITIGLTFITLLFGAQILDQLEAFGQQISEGRESIRDELQGTERGREILRQLPDEAELNDVLSAGGSNSIMGQAIHLFSATLAFFSATIIVLFIGIFFAVDPTIYLDNLIRLVPIKRRSRAREILEAVGKNLRKWLVARFISMMIVGVFTSLTLWLIGMPLPLMLGFIAGLFTIVPTFGPLASVIPAVLLAFTKEPIYVVYVLILYTAVQQIEEYAITPFIIQQKVSLPPGLVLGAQLVLGLLFGFLGIALAAPLMAAFVVLVRMAYVEDALGDIS